MPDRQTQDQLNQGAPAQSAGALLPYAISYLLLLGAFWAVARAFMVDVRLGGHFDSAFLSFALLLAPYWSFGFGLAGVLDRVRSRATRVLLPLTLALPYVVFSLPRGEFHASMAIALVAIPVGVAALFEFAPPATAAIHWQDVVALAALGLPVEFGCFRSAWPHPGLGSMPKLLLVDGALYAFLVIRRLPGVGFDFRPHLRDLAVGMREFACFAPFGIVIGMALGFIEFRPHWPGPAPIAGAWLVTFFFVAIPEELFFRGLLQNLVEQRAGKRAGYAIAAAIFGLSHFNKPLPFNWRYVLLATVAGVFYGRAWRDRQRLLSSAITHATVDAVWGLWFRV
jgi:uncharacterized protein